MVSDRKFGQQLYGYTANTSGTGTHTYNTLANEYVYVANGGNFDQTSNTTETSYDVYLPEVLSFSDYYPFGMEMEGPRSNSSNGTRHGYQGSEKDNEFKGYSNSYYTFYRHLDPRIGKWLSIDPKSNENESPFLSMGNNPIINNDIYGDVVSYEKFGDRMRVFFGKIFNGDFRREHRARKSDQDQFHYMRNKALSKPLVHSTQGVGLGNDEGRGQLGFLVDYNRGWGLNDIDNNFVRVGLKLVRYPFAFAFRLSKLVVGVVIGLPVVGIRRLFGDKDAGWGFAIEVMSHSERRHSFAFGIGNYNEFNMWGGELGSGPEKPVKLYSEESLFAIRWSGSKKRPVQLLEIGFAVHPARWQHSYFMHFNFMKNSKIKKETDDDKKFDFKN